MTLGIIMDTALLLATLGFIIPMCFSPGPNNVLCAAHGAQHGFRRTIPLIAGMAIGWSLLGLFVGAATSFIENNESFFELLTIIGAAYIAYLSFKLATAPALSEDFEGGDRLGILTGVVLQVVNGKAWIHFLLLMTSFGGLFGVGFTSKAMLVLLNLFFGLPAVMTWAYSGNLLRKTFSSSSSSIILNRSMGILLFSVAIWIVVH